MNFITVLTAPLWTCMLPHTKLIYFISLTEISIFPVLYVLHWCTLNIIIWYFQCGKHMGGSLQSIWTFRHSWMMLSVLFFMWMCGNM
jgi:hypothetical protein